MNPRRLLALLFAAALIAGCGSSSDGAAETTDSTLDPDRVRKYDVEVLIGHPHDPAAFTQGLVLDDGSLLESTGQYGLSSVREVEIDTGTVTNSVMLPSDMFGEGLALVGDRLIQLTWREGVARVYDRETLEIVDEFSYDGDGWGLCLDDNRLVMSDGSDTLTFRDPETFEKTGTVSVAEGRTPVDKLNELECVDGQVYANIYNTDEIAIIDPDDGQIAGRIDAGGLLADVDAAGAGPLNGIAYVPDTGHFYLTGKNWPVLFEVNLFDIDERLIEEKAERQAERRRKIAERKAEKDAATTTLAN